MKLIDYMKITLGAEGTRRFIERPYRFGVDTIEIPDITTITYRYEAIEALMAKAHRLSVARYKHDCVACHPLGRYKKYDLYVCYNEKVRDAPLIARHGDEVDEYDSITFSNEALNEGVYGELRKRFLETDEGRRVLRCLTLRKLLIKVGELPVYSDFSLLPEVEAKDLFNQVAEGLPLVLERIYHGDKIPENVLSTDMELKLRTCVAILCE